MKISLLSMAIVGPLLTTHPGNPMVIGVADHVPRLPVEATCRASVEAAKSTALPESFENCMRDENAAREQLGPIWAKSASSVRASCEKEAVAAGNASYVDLLTCLEMASEASNANAQAQTSKGASRNRNRH